MNKSLTFCITSKIKYGERSTPALIKHQSVYCIGICLLMKDNPNRGVHFHEGPTIEK